MKFASIHAVTQTKRSRAPGFTLPELLVVIAIISILASAVLAGMASATAQAKIDRTRATIAKINSLLMEKWAAFEARRVPRVNPTAGLGATLGVRRVRLGMLREIIRAELPDRISDIFVVDADHNPLRPREYGANGYLSAADQIVATPSASRSFQRKATQVLTNGNKWTKQFQGGECLYMILSRMFVGDASVLEMFADSQIGDVDGDGMREIHDAWGTPIEFVRWAPGFRSPLQPEPDPDGDGINDIRPDPFDVFQVEPMWDTVPSFYVFPLVISAGPDGKFGIATENVTGAYVNEYSHPYARLADGTLIGATIAVDETVDNISNHLIATL